MALKKIWCKPVAHFAGHILAGTIIFIMIGAVSFILAMLVRFLELNHAPIFTLQVLSLVEHVILLVDTVLYLGVSGSGTVKEMVK